MYVKINGVSSDTLSGVQVLSMPPITKPRMRTSVMTIDGRPGDIVTKLGYEAYNKKIDILLHGTYNLETVEAFFNTSGTIIFSNEPDRVYQFETIEAINFERAVKFKKASITFHVQPYKLKSPAESTTITGTSASITNSGNTASAPKLTITGSGTVTIRLDGSQVFSVVVPSGGITIDVAEMNAYSGNSLANRSVTGNYENFMLSPGSHTIARSGGTVSSMVIQNYSRWV